MAKRPPVPDFISVYFVCSVGKTLPWSSVIIRAFRGKNSAWPANFFSK